MANYTATTFQELSGAITAANASAGVNDMVFLSNDITLTADQVLSLTVPDGSGTLRIRSTQPTPAPAEPVAFTLTVVNDLAINDITPALVGGANPASFTIGPLVLRIGNGGTGGGLFGNLRGDDGGILAFNRSVDTTYTGTYSLEEENGLRNDVAGTTVILDGSSGVNGNAIASHVNGTGIAGSWDLEIDGDGDGLISGKISDTSTNTSGVTAHATGNVVKEGDGTWTFSAVNDYHGTTTIEEGTLIITGSIVNSATTVGAEGTLAGTGTLGDVTVSGVIKPGLAAGEDEIVVLAEDDEASIGTLTVGNLTIAPGGTVELEIGGPDAGASDEIVVGGTLTLGLPLPPIPGAPASDGAVLDISAVDDYVGAVGDEITIINVTGAAPVLGTFEGLAEGEIFEFADQTFTISYVGGDGNDIVLIGADEGDENANIFRLTGDGTTAAGLGGGDTYYVDSSADIVIEEQSGGKDTVYSTVTYALADEVEVLRLQGSGNINGYGNDGDNFIFGNAGKNVLKGGEGRDTLNGGAGKDIFSFDVDASRANADHITSFQHHTDRIRLNTDIFDALDNGTLGRNEFKTLGSKLDLDDRIIYDRSTGNLFYDANGSAKGARELIVTIDNKAHLTFDDIYGWSN